MKILKLSALSLFIIASTGMLTSVAAEEAALVDFDCQIKFVGRHQIEVTAVAKAEGLGGSEALTHTLIRYDGQRIKDLRVKGQDGRPVEFQLGLEHRVLRLKSPVSSLRSPGNPDLTYTIEYKIETMPGEPPRIPLPVPDLRARPGKRAVHISVSLPEGEVATLDSFPSFTGQGPGRAYIDLANVPSFIRLRSRRSVSWIDRLTDVSNLNDAIIVALIIFGTLVWKFKYKAQAR